MPTFIHAADLHLDSPLQRLKAYEGAPVDQIREAARRALENLVQLAIEREVDLVVIAGDLYDGDWQDHNTGLFFVSQVSKLVRHGIPVVAISGNHDAQSQMTRSLPLPKNPDGSDIMLSSRKAESRRFPESGFVVHGRSFGNRAETENMLPGYPAADGGMFNIGLLHTSLTGAEGHDNYAPCTPADLVAKQYQYWALGHVHTRGEHHDQTDPTAAPILFSGNIQGRHPRETGPKGCVIVDVASDGKPTHSFHPLDVVRWEICPLDLSSVERIDDLYDRYSVWLRDAIEQAEDRILVHRVRLFGTTKLHGQLTTDLVGIENSLRAIALNIAGEQSWLERVRLKTTLPVGDLQDFDPTGPLGCLETVLAEWRDVATTEDDEQPHELHEALSDLIRKLPDELTNAQLDPLQLTTPEMLQELVAAARPLLHAELRQTEG